MSFTNHREKKKNETFSVTKYVIPTYIPDNYQHNMPRFTKINNEKNIVRRYPIKLISAFTYQCIYIYDKSKNRAKHNLKIAYNA